MNRFLIVVLCLYTFFKIAESQPTCTEVGDFEIYDGTCKNYYICVDDGMKLIPVTIPCAPSAIFDPTEHRCVLESMTTYTCPQTTTMAPSTTSAPLCLRYGRFPIPDANCKKYYFCYWASLGYIKMNNLSCPNTLVFNPTIEKCVSPTTYKCPGITK